MEEADNIIILGLKDIGCALDDEVNSIAKFDADILFRACVAYIRLIDETRAANFAESLPRNMSARVNALSTLAATIRELGYRTELGYHQLLYPNANDSRKILIWLQQQYVPKKGLENEDASPALLSANISKCIIQAMKDSWCPSLSGAKPAFLLSTTALRVPARGRAVKTTPGLEKYYTQYLPLATAQPVRREDVAPSMIESNLAFYADSQERENEWNTLGLDSGLNPMEYKKRKLNNIMSDMNAQLRAVSSDSAKKLSEALQQTVESSEQRKTGFQTKRDFTHEESLNDSVEPQEKESDAERELKREQEIEALQAQLSKIEQEIANMNQESQSFASTVRMLESRLQEEDARRQVLEKEYRIKKRTYDLLPDAEKNIAELQSMSNAAAQRMLELATEWEKHRVPLVEEYRKLKDKQLNKQDETKEKLEKIKAMRAQMKALVEEIHQKDESYKQMLDALEALPKDVSRANYTRRILEIVKNVKKQKVDIDRVLIDTRNLKKEINNVSDTLGRIFSVVDELVFQDANVKKDPSAIQAYKHLASMDENFKKLVSTIEETGTQRTNILALEQKLEQIQVRTSALNVDEIVKNLKDIKAQNQELVARSK